MMRQRGKNYTKSEKFRLLELVQEYEHVVENKKTDSTTNSQKKTTWGLIAKRFNSSSQTGQRSANQLKMLYETLKKIAKRDRAEGKVQLHKTASAAPTLREKILRILGDGADPTAAANDGNMLREAANPREGSPTSTVIKIEPDCGSPGAQTTGVLCQNRRKDPKPSFNRRKENLKLKILQCRYNREVLLNKKFRLEIEEKKLDILIKKRQL